LQLRTGSISFGALKDDNEGDGDGAETHYDGGSTDQESAAAHSHSMRGGWGRILNEEENLYGKERKGTRK
jgi:hypothetical protein